MTHIRWICAVLALGAVSCALPATEVLVELGSNLPTLDGARRALELHIRVEESAT